MRTDPSNVRTPADSSTLRPSNLSDPALDPASTGAAIDIGSLELGPRMTAKEFLAKADAIVDALSEARTRRGGEPLPEDLADYLRGAYLDEFLRHKYPPPARPRPLTRTLPPRFKREPAIFLGNVRFGRLRLFLSKWIGDMAWRGTRL